MNCKLVTTALMFLFLLSLPLTMSSAQEKTTLPVKYEDIEIDAGFRIDMIVNDSVIIENKTVDKIAPIHEAQLLTYLKIANLKLGFLLNWNVPLMKDGIRRMVNNL